LFDRHTSDGVASAEGAPGQLLDWRAAKNDAATVPDCVGGPVERCTLVRGTGEHVLLLGDSHAQMWAPALEQVAKTESLTFSVGAMSACPWQRGLTYAEVGGAGSAAATIARQCREHQADWYDRVIPALHPDVVVVAQPYLEETLFALPMRFPDGQVLAATDDGFAAALRDATRAAMLRLRAQVEEVVVFEPVPSTYPFDPLNCLSRGRPAARCAHSVENAPSMLEGYYRELEREPHFSAVDLDRVVCPRLPVCDAVVDDVIVRFDSNGHLTATFARSVAPQVAAVLRAREIIGA
jgi:hypothetical protein